MKDKSQWILSKSQDTPLEKYERLIEKDKKNENRWKYFAYISLFGFVSSLIVLIYAINLPRTVPVIITLSDFGEAKYIGEATKFSYNGANVPEIAIEYQIRKFTTNRFSVPGDPDILRNNLIDCYSCLTGDSASKLSNQLKENNPLKNYGTVRKTVEIESVISLSKNSYQIDFYVITTNPKDTQKIRTRMRGIMTVGLLEPSEEDKLLNPLGIYIRNFDYTEIK